MKTYDFNDNPYDAVNTFLKNGIVVIEGTKTNASDYMKRVLKCLEPYNNISPIESYKNVPKNGYFYFIFDGSKFNIGDKNLNKLLIEIDALN